MDEPSAPGDDVVEDAGSATADAHDVLQLAERYRLRAHRKSRAHYLAAAADQRMHTYLGIPVVALTAVVGTAIFGTVSSDPAPGWAVAAGTVSVVAAVLAALQTFFGFGARGQRHKAAAGAYASLKRQLDLLRLRGSLTHQSSVDVLEALTALTSRFDEVEQESPEIRDKYYDLARAEERADDEGV